MNNRKIILDEIVDTFQSENIRGRICIIDNYHFLDSEINEFQNQMDFYDITDTVYRINLFTISNLSDLLHKVEELQIDTLCLLGTFHGMNELFYKVMDELYIHTSPNHIYLRDYNTTNEERQIIYDYKYMIEAMKLNYTYNELFLMNNNSYYDYADIKLYLKYINVDIISENIDGGYYKILVSTQKVNRDSFNTTIFISPNKKGTIYNIKNKNLIHWIKLQNETTYKDIVTYTTLHTKKPDIMTLLSTSDNDQRFFKDLF